MASFSIRASPGPAVGLLAPCHRRGQGQWGLRSGARGRVNGTCSLLVPLPVTFTSKSQEVLPFLCRLPADRGLCSQPGFRISAVLGVGTPGGTRERAVCAERLPRTRGSPFGEAPGCTRPRAGSGKSRARPRLAGPSPCPRVVISIPARQGPAPPPSTPPLPHGPCPPRQKFSTSLHREVLPLLGNSFANGSGDKL